jgi:TPP-dependent pyruvate/acetoin dehydrogenase alpha subunit
MAVSESDFDFNAPDSSGLANERNELERISAEDLETLVLIRVFERTLLELFSSGELDGTTHTCMGQEFVPVAISSLLQESDFVFSNHRGHGHYLARYKDAAGLLAEIMGRDGAICGGVGGSQHIKRSNYLSTGIQGESVGVAVGVALSAKRRKTGGLALAYIGDGTWGQGLVYEALNLASLWRTPLALIVENNGIAQTTPIELNLAGSIEARARAFDVNYVRAESGCSLARIREVAAGALTECRSKFRPVVVECFVDRLGPHSKGDDTRDEKTQSMIRDRDWFARCMDGMPERFNPIVAKVEGEMETIVADVRSRPPVGKK